MFTFRRLTRGDFGLLARWLAEPHVHEWWDHEYTDEALEHDFGASIDGDDPMLVMIAQLDDEPVGLIQYVYFPDEAEYVAEMSAVYPVGEGAGSIDYFVGEPDAIGRGVGTAMIAAFIDELWQTRDRLDYLVVPVNSANERSWRALLRAGFHLVARGELEPDSPRHEPMHEILRLDRPAPIHPAGTSVRP